MLLSVPSHKVDPSTWRRRRRMRRLVKVEVEVVGTSKAALN